MPDEKISKADQVARLRIDRATRKTAPLPTKTTINKLRGQMAAASKVAKKKPRRRR